MDRPPRCRPPQRKAAPALRKRRAQTPQLPACPSRNRAGYFLLRARLWKYFLCESCRPRYACKSVFLNLAHYPIANPATCKGALATSPATCRERVVKRQAGQGDRSCDPRVPALRAESFDHRHGVIWRTGLCEDSLPGEPFPADRAGTPPRFRPRPCDRGAPAFLASIRLEKAARRVLDFC